MIVWNTKGIYSIFLSWKLFNILTKHPSMMMIVWKKSFTGQILEKSPFLFALFWFFKRYIEMPSLLHVLRSKPKSFIYVINQYDNKFYAVNSKNSREKLHERNTRTSIFFVPRLEAQNMVPMTPDSLFLGPSFTFKSLIIQFSIDSFSYFWISEIQRDQCECLLSLE